VDGRHERRRRNREAAIEALIALMDEGHANPTIADVAQRAGVSPRSLFRYFDDVSDLSREAVGRVAAEVLPLVERFDVDPSLPLAHRTQTVAAAVDLVYQRVRRVGLVARVKAPVIAEVAQQQVETRRVVRSMLERTFAPELDACRSQDRGAVLTALEVWCSFDCQHLLHAQGVLDDVDPVRVTELGLNAALRPVT
jgi:AcrR family transcriptional regulator